MPIKLLALPFFIFLFSIASGQGLLSSGRDTARVRGDSAKLLAQAVVNGKKPVIQQLIDRIRFNVAGTDLVQGASLWDLLARTPLVSVSEDGTISIAGTTGAVVYINNKRKVLSGEALKAYLSALPADKVEAIDVFTTPPSKYDAEGGAGVLNIVTAKRKQDGFDGSLVLSDRQTALNSQSGSVFLNDRSGPWDVYSTIYGVDRRRRPVSSQDFFYGAGDLLSSSIQAVNSNRYAGAGANVGVDYQVTPKQVVGLVFDYSGNWNHNPHSAYSYDRFTAASASSSADSLSYSNNLDRINSGTYSLNLNYDGRLDSTGQRLSVDLDALRYLSSYHSVSQTSALDEGSGKPLYLQDYFRSSSPQDVRNQSAKADLTWPLGRGLSLEAGAKVSFSQINNDLVFENNAGGSWVFDPTRSNVFRYDEDIAAVYGTLNGRLSSHWAYQVGTRLENTVAKGYLDGALAVNKNYLNAFPTGFLKFSPTAKQTYVLAVSSRISRPSYWDVNPFRTYTTDKTYWEGNPFLQPSRYYREELRRTFAIRKASLTVMVAAAQTLNEFHSLPYNDTGDVVVFKQVNYGNRYIYTGSLIYTQAFAPWWQFSSTILTGWERTIGNYEAVAIDNRTFLFTLQTNQVFTISRGLSCTVIANNSLPSTIVNTRIGDRFDTEVRVRKTSGPFNFTLSVTDIFKTNRDTYLVHANELKAIEDFYNDTRSVAVTMNYNFGKATVKKNRDRDMPFQDVKERIM